MIELQPGNESPWHYGGYIIDPLFSLIWPNYSPQLLLKAALAKLYILLSKGKKAPLFTTDAPILATQRNKLTCSCFELRPSLLESGLLWSWWIRRMLNWPWSTIRVFLLDWDSTGVLQPVKLARCTQEHSNSQRVACSILNINMFYILKENRKWERSITIILIDFVCKLW